MFMDLFQAIQLLLRPTISETQITEGEKRLASLIQRALRLHRGLNRSKNLHQAIHIPGNIRDHGPPVGWWLFSSERMNKTLKNMNSNGQTRKTALIAFNAYQRYARSNQLMNTSTMAANAGTDEMMTMHIARILAGLFKNSSAQHYSTEEQETARAWEESENALRNGSLTSANRQSGIALSSGTLNKLDIITQAVIQQHLRTIGIDAQRVRHGEFRLHDNDLLVDRDCLSYGVLKVGKAKFEPWVGQMEQTMSETQLRETLDNFVEFREQKPVYTCADQRCSVALIQRIFRHRTITVGGDTHEYRLYLQIRRLQPFDGVDRYGFRNL